MSEQALSLNRIYDLYVFVDSRRKRNEIFTIKNYYLYRLFMCCTHIVFLWLECSLLGILIWRIYGLNSRGKESESFMIDSLVLMLTFATEGANFK